MKHLRPATRKWIEEVCATYVIETANLRLLVLAGEALDLAEHARELIATQGLLITNAHGGAHAHPAVAIARDATLRFARLVRAAGLLDVDTPSLPLRPPASPRGRARKGKEIVHRGQTASKA